MGSGLIQSSPVAAEHDSGRKAIVIAILVVVAIAVIIAVLLRQPPRQQSVPPAYASNLQLTDLKMSQAQNFVGSTATYVDGTLVNNGDKTVIHAIARVTFRDPYGQIAQVETVPIRALKTSGPYPDTSDLAASPVASKQSRRFRLIFEHVSGQWSQGYPELQIIDVATK